ncbi:hypothetical protein ACM66B_004569 [Microbotryomycetes sp. NB124-2]
MAEPEAELAHAPIAGPSRELLFNDQPAQRVITPEDALEASQRRQFYERASFILIGLERATADRAWDATRWINGPGVRPSLEDRFTNAVKALCEQEWDKALPIASSSKAGAADSIAAGKARKVVQFVDLAEDSDSSDVEVQAVAAGSVKFGRKFGEGSSSSRAGSSSKSGRKSWPQEPVPPDPLDTVLAVFPDVDPDHVRKMLFDFKHNNSAESVVEALLTSTDYPKIDKKGKKRAREEEPAEQPEKDYLDKSRPAPDKETELAALARLNEDFPTIAVNKIEQIFRDNNKHFAPTYLAIDKALQQTEAQRGWKLIKHPRKPKGKDKAPAFLATIEQERNWVFSHIRERLQAELREKALAQKLEQEIKDGAFFECGCCFGESALSTLVMCSMGHSFCKDCAVANAETQIGMRKYILPCMSVEGCEATFDEADMRLVLSASSWDALCKIRTEKELDEAALLGLEKCPRCPFACVIENPHERLLRCLSEDCGFVSCRQCKKEDHLPKTCEEAGADDKISSIHKVEEAMSAALIRNCPKPGCGEPFVKEDGCNKMRCPSCQTLSCYICRKVIKGYDHFRNAGLNAKNPDPTAQCNLWDDSVKRNYDEVEAARLEAGKVVAKEDPRVNEADLAKLNLPKPPPKPGNPYYDDYGRYVPAPPPVLDAAAQARLREAEERRREQDRRALEAMRQRLEDARRRNEEDLRRQQTEQRQKEAARDAKRQRLTGQARRR